jgi:hypothetical protein
MSKTSSTGAFVSTPLVSPSPPPSYGATDKASGPTKPTPGATPSGLAARNVSLTGGSAGRVSLSALTSAAAPTSFVRQQANVPPSGSPIEMARQVFKDFEAARNSGNENPNHVPFEAIIGVAILAALMHRLSQSSAAI